jgi:tetratricopeptide (TPR) repeat protein
MLALAALASLLTYETQREAMRALQHLSLGARIANAVDAYSSYIGKAIWPEDLVFFYPHPGDALEIAEIIGAALLLVALTLIALRCARSHAYLAMGWLWYLGTLVPVIGIVQVGKQAMADRYTYIPLIGLFIAAVWWVADRMHAWRRGRGLLAAAAAAVGLALILATRQQVAHWRDDFSLYEHALLVNPDNAVAHHNLGLALSDAKRLEEAVEHFQRAIEIDPNFANAYIDLGIDLDDLGRREEATRSLVRASEIEPGNPAAHYNLGVVYLEQGEIELARAALERTIEIQPRHALANLYLGSLLASLKRFDEAAAHFRTAIAANPQNASAHLQLGLVHAMTGQFDDAIAELETALRIDPRAPRAREMLELARRAKAAVGSP